MSPSRSQSIPEVTKALRDPRRLNALAASSLLDSPVEQIFDRFTELASRIIHAPVTLVSLVDKDHQSFKSQVGLPEPYASTRCTPLSHSFCQFVVASAQPLVVTDAREHSLLRDNEAIHDLGVIAYLGVPLTTSEGLTLGSFCAIDSKPRTWTGDEIETLRGLASFLVSEIELRILGRHFQTNFMRLRQLELERDELVHLLVHDLRNPLSSLISALDLSKDADTEEEAASYREIATFSARSVLTMVSDILDVSKSEAGRLTLNLAPVAPHELVKLAAGMVREMSVAAEIALTTEASPYLPVLQADQEKLRRVLVNLISNAIQHTPRGGSVEVCARQEANCLVFTVADTGRGIPKEAFSQIFEKFGKNASRQCGRVSSGLGLHFCKMAIEAHAGNIMVESELGKGTTFRFDVPLQARAANGKA